MIFITMWLQLIYLIHKGLDEITLETLLYMGLYTIYLTHLVLF